MLKSVTVSSKQTAGNHQRLPRQLWAIVVPLCYNDGSPIPRTITQQFEVAIRQVSGGLTRINNTTGIWGEQKEMGSVWQFISTPQEVGRLIALAKILFVQHAIMAYKVSDRVIIR
jgi:hypothetical protein